MRPDRSTAASGDGLPAARPAPAPGRIPLRSATGRAVVAAAVLGSALAYMSDDMLNLAIPSVAADLGGTVRDLQWVVNSYYVTLVAVVLVAGALGDIVGHRRVFLAGLGLFAAGALGCAASPAVGLLIAGRGVQGVGAALTLAAGLALVSRLIRPEERGRAIGLFMGAVAALPTLGPFLSGLIVDLLSWRAIFLAPLVFPLAAVFITRALVPETGRASGRRPDLPGAAAALTGLAAVTVALVEGPGRWTRPVPLAAVGVAVVSAALFVMIERRMAEPMVPLSLFRRKAFAGGNAVMLLAVMASTGTFFFVAVSLQVTLGYRPLLAGLALVPLYLVMTFGAPLAGRLADRIGPRLPTLAGLAVFGVGIWMLSRLGPESDLISGVLPGLLVMACGAAAFGAPLAAATLGALDEADQGVAAGMNHAVGQLAGLLAIAVLPAAAGLTDTTLGGPSFAGGHSRALRIAVGLVAAAVLLAALSVRSSGPRRGPSDTDESPGQAPHSTEAGG